MKKDNSDEVRSIGRILNVLFRESTAMAANGFTGYGRYDRNDNVRHFFILADGKKMRAHVGKEEKRIFSVCVCVGGGSFRFHNICLFGVFFSLWRHPWAILWSYEAVWSGRITSYNTVPVPWWLCWPWLLQYWGKSKRILLRTPRRNPNRKKNITSNIFLVLVSTVCFIPLVAENPLSKDTIFTPWKSWM